MGESVEPQMRALQPVPALSVALPAIPWLGHGLHIARDVLGFTLQAQEAFPEICRTRVGPKKLYLVFHPNLVQQILVKNYRNYSKDMFLTRSLSIVLGEGLLTSNGEKWQQSRKIAQPVFHQQRIRQILVDMEQSVTQRVTELSSSLGSQATPFELGQEFSRLTLKIITQVILGEDLSRFATRLDVDFPFLTEFVYTHAMRPWNAPLGLPLPKHRRLKRVLASFDKIVAELIHKRRSVGGTGQSDLLSMLVDARDEDSGQGLSDREIRDQVMTLFLGGNETTTNTLQWLFYLLSEHPAQEQKLLRSLQNGDKSYLEAVIKETMRLYPAGWSLVRKCEQSDNLGGYAIPAGSLMVLFPWATHRHPQFWSRAQDFVPERFMDPTRLPEHKFAYFPFGGGPRMCIGAALARAVIEGVAREFVLHFSFKIEPGSPIVPRAETTLGMASPLRGTLSKRSANDF